MKRLIVFTDLDGTLLDHHSYSWEPAAPALDRLNALGIPLILNSSKTIAEMAQIRERLGNDQPFIVENGGAVCLPRPDDGTSFTRHLFGQPYAEILSVLGELRRKGPFRFRGFSDMTDAELAELTGLSRREVVLAKRRCCSEPLLWLGKDAERDRFAAELAERELQLVGGGRFVHVMGRTDKGSAMRWVVDRLESTDPGIGFTTVALGDSANDRPMLERADHAVVIRPAKGEPLALERTDNVIYTEEKGPAGWKAAMEKILDETGA